MGSFGPSRSPNGRSDRLMAQSNQRFALDLDDIERQLKQTQLQSPPSKSDPLAELARIVGQNDPFGTLLADKQARIAEDEALFAEPAGSPGHGYVADPLSVSPSDRAAAPRASQQAYAPPTGSYDESPEEFYPLEPRRSRRGLITVVVVLGTAIAAVSGALMLRNRPVTTASGEPPIIKAESDPLKIKPENPGGVEIPNQNAQVYERGGPDKQTRVVNREEQPVDVQQAARAAPTGPASVTTPNNAVASLGEPRRVRTVSVRPDGTIVSPDQPTVAVPPLSASPAPSRPAEPTLSSSSGATPAPTAPQADAPARPRTEARPTVPATTATPSQPPPAARPAPAVPPSSPLSIGPNGAQQAAAPQRTATVAPPRAADASETTSAAGGFSVQLSVANAEDAARAQAQALQRKYAGELGGRSALVRTAEVNGKTLYRVRVGPMSKDDANELCAKVKGAGGEKACFVARN